MNTENKTKSEIDFTFLAYEMLIEKALFTIPMGIARSREHELYVGKQNDDDQDDKKSTIVSNFKKELNELIIKFLNEWDENISDPLITKDLIENERMYRLKYRR
jgi:hypothetical protein